MLPLNTSIIKTYCDKQCNIYIVRFHVLENSFINKKEHVLQILLMHLVSSQCTAHMLKNNLSSSKRQVARYTGGEGQAMLHACSSFIFMHST